MRGQSLNLEGIWVVFAAIVFVASPFLGLWRANDAGYNTHGTPAARILVRRSRPTYRRGPGPLRTVNTHDREPLPHLPPARRRP